MEIKGRKSWVIMSVDGVLACSKHRDNIRPKYSRNNPPSGQAIKEWMDQAINDRPIPEGCRILRAMLMAGHRILIVGQVRFPVADWFAKYLPEVPMDRIYTTLYATGPKGERDPYDKHLLGQLSAMHEQQMTVTMAVLRSALWQSYVRFLWPTALVGCATPEEGPAAEKRREGKVASNYRNLGSPPELVMHRFDQPRQRRGQARHKPQYLNLMGTGSRWLDPDHQPT